MTSVALFLIGGKKGDERNNVMKCSSAFVRLCVIVAVITWPVSGSAATAFPSKSLRMILPGPPGGGADRLARVLAQRMSETMGQAVVVDNRPGAGGLLGMDLAAKAAPDGYTIVMGNSGPNAVIPNIRRKTPYDPIRDFSPISLVASTTNILVVNPSIPALSVTELISLAKSKPGELTFASGGTGQASHLAGELFKLSAKIDLVHVPYKGSGPALTDVIGGRVSVMFENIPSSMPHVLAGRLRVLAVTSAKRSRLVPDLPTVSESGLHGYESIQWYGMLAPAGTPVDIVSRLTVEIVGTIRVPEIQDLLLKQGFDLIGSSPAEFAEYIRAELGKWKKVVTAAGISAD